MGNCLHLVAMLSVGPMSMSPAEVAAAVEAELRRFVAGRGLPADLAEAILYAGLGPGKRVRPLLVVRACEAVAGIPAASPSLSGGVGRVPGVVPGVGAGAIAGRAAVEKIHAFSLVHDDLPAMDDDDLRRGRPTLHRHAGEAMALLAGDSLLALAFEVLSHRVEDGVLALALIRELSRGTNDMIAGQVYDTLASPSAAGDPPLSPLERLVRTHRLKTGALLRAAARMGGLCGGATAAQLDALTRYADAIGLMFQVVDDLLDVTADAAELGKATRKDVAAGKLTYPGLLGIDGARAEVARLRDEAREAVAGFGGAADPLRKMADDLAVRRK